MVRNLASAFILLLAFSASAESSLADLIAQKRCTPDKNKPNEFDCMVDQPDGSVKQIRYFQAKNVKKSSSSKKEKNPSTSD